MSGERDGDARVASGVRSVVRDCRSRLSCAEVSNSNDAIAAILRDGG